MKGTDSDVSTVCISPEISLTDLDFGNEHFSDIFSISPSCSQLDCLSQLDAVFQKDIDLQHLSSNLLITPTQEPSFRTGSHTAEIHTVDNTKGKCCQKRTKARTKKNDPSMFSMLDSNLIVKIARLPDEAASSSVLESISLKELKQIADTVGIQARRSKKAVGFTLTI